MNVNPVLKRGFSIRAASAFYSAIYALTTGNRRFAERDHREGRPSNVNVPGTVRRAKYGDVGLPSPSKSAVRAGRLPGRNRIDKALGSSYPYQRPFEGLNTARSSCRRRRSQPERLISGFAERIDQEVWVLCRQQIPRTVRRAENSLVRLGVTVKIPLSRFVTRLSELGNPVNAGASQNVPIAIRRPPYRKVRFSIPVIITWHRHIVAFTERNDRKAPGAFLDIPRCVRGPENGLVRLSVPS